MMGNVFRVSNVISIFLLLLSSYRDVLINGKEKSFCSTNLYENNDTWLQFTKEINTIDYVVLELYKSLSCCAKGYTRIEWYKGDNLISLDEEFPTFNNLEDENQTLVSKRVVQSDDGIYTCKVFNETNMILHKIRLKVLPSKPYKGEALLTYPSPEVLERDDSGVLHWKEYAEVGDTKRFLCEGFIGIGNELASQVTWTFDDMTFVNSTDGHLYTSDTLRRNKNMTIGQYLYFKNVEKEDFRTYTCSISNGKIPKVIRASLKEGVDPKNIRTAVKPTLIVIAVFVCSTAMLLVAYKKWRLELHLFWKDRFGKIEDDNKEYDVFVCYDQSDADFALGVLVHILENVYKYKCFAYERDSMAGEWIPEIYTAKIKSSRRFVMVLSKALAVNSWCTYALYIAIEAMLNLHSKIICVEFEDIPWDDLQQPESAASDLTLQQVLKVVRKVRWEPAKPKYPPPSILELLHIENSRNHIQNSDSDSESLCEEINYGSDKFWTSLRIHLPPRRDV